MARENLTVTGLVPNGGVAQPAGVTGIADGHYIDTNARTGVRDQVKAEDLILQVTVATAESDVTIKAGDYPPAIAAPLGDLVKACPVGTTFLGPFESGRFQRRDGRIHIDYETPANVTIRAYRFERAA